MPTTCDPAELIDNARLLDCCIPKGLQLAVLILLFGELVDVPSDAETLLNDSKCLDQCIPEGSKLSVLISLACQLVKQGGSENGYKVYRALLDQSGTNAPVATVLENTLGGTPVWSRIQTGRYAVTLAGVFVRGKTFTIVEADNESSNASYIGSGQSNDDSIKVFSYDSNHVDVELGTGYSPIEILVYP